MTNDLTSNKNTYITVLPLANVSIWSFGHEVVAVDALVAAGQVRTGLEQLWPNELELTVIVVEVSMDLQLCEASHGQKFTSIPETSKLI